MSNRIDIKGVRELTEQLGAVAAMKTLESPMQEALAHMQSKLSLYPPVRRRTMKFVSAKQRRFFFVALRKGQIEVPYVRTGKLGQVWTPRITRAGTNQHAAQLTGILGNNRPQAPWVQGPKHPNQTPDGKSQAAYHVGNWSSVEDVVQQEEGYVTSLFERAIQEAVK